MELSKLANAISDKDLRAELTKEALAKDVSAFEDVNAPESQYLAHINYPWFGVRKD